MGGFLDLFKQRLPTSDEVAGAQVSAMQHHGTAFRGADTPSMLGTGMNNKLNVAVPQKDYLPKDIVVFKDANGGHTAHRVVAVKPGFVFTKGDMNPNGDGWIPLTDVVGKINLPEKR